MSRSFQLTGGDLTVGSSRAFSTLSGKEKLFQDLRLWLLERIGTDPATPTYGSTLDGGVIDGVEIPSYIGSAATRERLNEIRSEIATILNRYQEDQLEKMRNEVLLFQGKHTLSPDEILQRVDSIEAAMVGTTVVVRVTCTTLDGQNFNLIVPVGV